MYVCVCVWLQIDRTFFPLLDQLVGSLVGFIDAKFVHLRLKERNR